MNKTLIAVLAGALLLAGCNAKVNPTALPAASTPVTTAVAPAATKAIESEAVEPGEEGIVLGDVFRGLSKLNSYKSVLSISFDGKDADGNPVKRSVTMEEWFSSNPPAHFFSMSTEESADGTVTEQTYSGTVQLSDAEYHIMRLPDGTEYCTVTFDGMDSLPSQQTSNTWDWIGDTRYKGTETVNGVRTKHYVWDEGAVGDDWFIDLKGLKGETWLAVDGGYVVRQVVELPGTSEFFATEGETGVMRWELNVLEANKPIEIKAPEGCASASAEPDLPIMPDAIDRVLMDNMITYASSSAMEDVIAFYQQQLAAAGWEASEEPMVMEGVALLSFARDEESVSLTIASDDESEITIVMITISQP